MQCAPFQWTQWLPKRLAAPVAFLGFTFLASLLPEELNWIFFIWEESEIREMELLVKEDMEEEEEEEEED